MAEMLNYQNDLTSITQGRASFSMEFDHYDYVPQLQAEKIIAAAKAARTGEEEVGRGIESCRLIGSLVDTGRICADAEVLTSVG